MGEVPCVRWIRSQDSSRRSTATAAAALRQVLTWGDDDESGATSRSSERTTASQWMASRSLRGSGRNSGQRSTATAAAALTWGRRRRETDRELGERKPLVRHRVRRGGGVVGGITAEGETGTARRHGARAARASSRTAPRLDHPRAALLLAPACRSLPPALIHQDLHRAARAWPSPRRRAAARGGGHPRRGGTGAGGAVPRRDDTRVEVAETRRDEGVTAMGLGARPGEEATARVWGAAGSDR